VVAFDVDGVLLRRLFLAKIAWQRGPSVWLRSLWLGLLLKVGMISVRQAVERAYGLQRGTSVDDLLGASDALELAPGAAEVCSRLRASGYVVVLVSAGVPQEVVERIGARVGADASYGILLEAEGGILTGRVIGDRHSPEGKRAVLESALRVRGFRWSDATVVVDDQSNAAIVDAAWRSIGVNPERQILTQASFIIHTTNLLEILEFFPEGYEVGVTPQWLAVRHEFFRKTIHACAVFVPLIALWSKTFTLWLVASVTLLFLLSEVFRFQGVAVPLFANVTWRALRSHEQRGIVMGPVLFGAGIWLTVAVFSPEAAACGVLILAIGDSVASLVGRAFGYTLLPHNPRKTLIGSVSLFGVGVLVAIFYVSLPWALLVGTVASVLESLPVGAADNFLLPIGTAAMLTFAVGVG
jgi:dolichol kinase/phosphoserine phosphatase